MIYQFNSSECDFSGVSERRFLRQYCQTQVCQAPKTMRLALKSHDFKAKAINVGSFLFTLSVVQKATTHIYIFQIPSTTMRARTCFKMKAEILLESHYFRCLDKTVKYHKIWDEITNLIRLYN